MWLLTRKSGFDPPSGSHQLPVFLKYSVRLKLLAQIDLREFLSSPFRQDVLKIFSILMYDAFGCGSLDSSLDVLFEGKFP